MPREYELTSRLINKRSVVEPEEEELSLSDGIIAFIETYLRVPEGAHVGQPVVLREWQKDIIRTIYGTPTRQAIISLGRKNGKTSFVAMIVLVHMVGPTWRRNSQIFSAAQSRDQAAIVFGLAAKMVRMSPVLSDPNQTVIRDSAKELFSPRTGVRYKALSAESTTAFGLSPTLVIHDEFGQVRGVYLNDGTSLATSIAGLSASTCCESGSRSCGCRSRRPAGASGVVRLLPSGYGTPSGNGMLPMAYAAGHSGM